MSDATDEAPLKYLLVNASKYRFVGASKFIPFGQDAQGISHAWRGNGIDLVAMARDRRNHRYPKLQGYLPGYSDGSVEK